MKTSDLRIGNYVFDEENDVVKICVVATDAWRKDFDSYADEFSVELDGEIVLSKVINPIPLTEEWLLKFGFERVDNDIHDDVWEAPHTGIIRFWHYQDRTPENNGYLFEDFDSHPAIKYVHQLQNLYFALTGEELKIKE